MRLKSFTAAALTLAFATGSAFAATTTTTFNFAQHTGYVGTSKVFTSMSGTQTLTATATRQNASGNPISGTAVLGQWNQGLGVCSSLRQNGSCREDHQVDGNGNDEAVLFEFNQEVTLESVTFSHVGNNDEFSFSFFDNNSSTATDFYSSVGLGNNGSIQTYVFGQTWTGNLFGIGATGHNDEFKIKSLIVSYTEMSEVPVPAAIWLFAPALAGFTALRRRRSAQ